MSVPLNENTHLCRCCQRMVEGWVENTAGMCADCYAICVSCGGTGLLYVGAGLSRYCECPIGQERLAKAKQMLPREIETALVDAALELAKVYEAYEKAPPQDRLEAMKVFREAAHRIELIAKKSVPSAEGILTEGAIQAVVRGSLKDTIASHGPITSDFVESAARRIGNGVLGHLRQASMEDISNISARHEVARLRKDVQEKEQLIQKKQEEIKKLATGLGLYGDKKKCFFCRQELEGEIYREPLFGRPACKPHYDVAVNLKNEKNP